MSTQSLAEKSRLARNTATPPDVLAKLAADSDIDVRYWVARNKAASSQLRELALADVPTVADLDIKVAEAVGTGGERLEMSNWHCGTSHCRAGWAIHLAGKEGYALENKFGPELAGGLIYLKSTGRTELPDFHCSNNEALKDIQGCAERARNAKAEGAEGAL